MKKTAALCLVLAATMTLAPKGAAARETSGDPRDDDRTSLASPDYEGYRPAWANPYAEPGDFGLNDDPTPFNPADVDSGPSPLDPDEY